MKSGEGGGGSDSEEPKANVGVGLARGTIRLAFEVCGAAQAGAPLLAFGITLFLFLAGRGQLPRRTDGRQTPPNSEAKMSYRTNVRWKALQAFLLKLILAAQPQKHSRTQVRDDG